MTALRKIGTIELCGRTYAIGKNGHYALVDESRTDAWGHPVGTIIEPHEAGGADVPIEQVCVALLDALGDAITRIKALELARERHLNKGLERVPE